MGAGGGGVAHGRAKRAEYAGFVYNADGIFWFPTFMIVSVGILIRQIKFETTGPIVVKFCMSIRHVI